MFKAKVSFYKKIDWVEKRIERKFSNSKAYNKFILSHPEYDFSENLKLVEKNITSEIYNKKRKAEKNH